MQGKPAYLIKTKEQNQTPTEHRTTAGTAWKAVASLLAARTFPNTLRRPLNYVPIEEISHFPLDSFFGATFAHFALKDAASPPVQLKPATLLQPQFL